MAAAGQSVSVTIGLVSESESLHYLQERLDRQISCGESPLAGRSIHDLRHHRSGSVKLLAQSLGNALSPREMAISLT